MVDAGWPLITCNVADLWSTRGGRRSLALAHRTQDVQEEVDDVEVEVDGGVHVVLGRDALHDHLCVEDDEEGEEDGSPDGEAARHRLAREEHLRTSMHCTRPTMHRQILTTAVLSSTNNYSDATIMYVTIRHVIRIGFITKYKFNFNNWSVSYKLFLHY